MAQNLSNFDAMLKYDYLPPAREQFNSATILMKRVEKDEENVVGKDCIMAANYLRNEGAGSRPDNASLPTAGNQGYHEIKFPVKYNYARIQVSGPTIKAAEKDAGAFARAIASEMKGAVRDLRKNINRQLFLDGKGKLATGAMSGAATTVTVNSTRRLRVGMTVVILNATSGAELSGAGVSDALKILSIPSSTTFTLTGTPSLNVTSTYGIYILGSAVAVSGALVSYDMMGLRGIVDAGTYATTLQGVLRSTYPSFNAGVLSNSGTNRDISRVLLQQSIDTGEESAAGKTSLMVTSYGVRRAYYDSEVSDKRYVNTMKLDGGFDALEFSGVPIVADTDCDLNTLFALDESSLKIYRQSDIFWMEEDGAILSRVSGYDAYEAILCYYSEFACDVPAKNTVIRDITEK